MHVNNQPARHLVDGSWVAPAGSGTVLPSPIRGTGTTVVSATANEISQAVAAAVRAQRDWGALTPAMRADQLSEAAERVEAATESIAQAMTREVRKTLAESRSEVANAVRLTRFFAQAVLRPTGEVYPTGRPRSTTFAERAPLGVVLAISPWNFPVNLTLLKVAPALAVGNAVVVKASPVAARTAERMLAAFTEALPPGLVNLLQGDGDVGRQLLRSDDIAAVSFTGSTAVGAAVARDAADRGIPCLAEMGGKNVLVIGPDADVPAAVTAALNGAFSMAGQKCTATSLLLVHRRVEQEVVALLEARASAGIYSVGDPFAEETAIGPLVSEAAATQVTAAVAEAEAGGARALRFGDALPPELTSAVSPVALFDVPVGCEVDSAEVFGPVLAIETFEDMTDAIDRINGLSYGLVSSVYTRDLDTAMRFSKAVNTGTVLVNQPTPGLDHNVPFVGWADSGLGGVEQSDRALDFYSRIKTTYLTW
jgi:acyl-CoA reductase-like NAD-dependent aldehyde dehydrogenase